jgi:hypothetical protein
VTVARGVAAGGVWTLEGSGGRVLVVSNDLYNQASLNTALVAQISVALPEFRPFCVPCEWGTVYADRLLYIPRALLTGYAGTVAAAQLAEVDKHLASLFRR